jgi:hypothetical protein
MNGIVQDIHLFWAIFKGLNHLEVCVRSFADLALQVFPDIGIHKFSFLHVLLSFQPFLQAGFVNVFHGPGTIAWAYEAIIGFLFGQADATDLLIFLKPNT